MCHTSLRTASSGRAPHWPALAHIPAAAHAVAHAAGAHLQACRGRWASLRGAAVTAYRTAPQSSQALKQRNSRVETHQQGSSCHGQLAQQKLLQFTITRLPQARPTVRGGRPLLHTIMTLAPCMPDLQRACGPTAEPRSIRRTPSANNEFACVLQPSRTAPCRPRTCPFHTAAVKCRLAAEAQRGDRSDLAVVALDLAIFKYGTTGPACNRPMPATTTTGALFSAKRWTALLLSIADSITHGHTCTRWSH